MAVLTGLTTAACYSGEWATEFVTTHRNRDVRYDRTN